MHALPHHSKILLNIYYLYYQTIYGLILLNNSFQVSMQNLLSLYKIKKVPPSISEGIHWINLKSKYAAILKLSIHYYHMKCTIIHKYTHYINTLETVVFLIYN